MNKTTGIVIDEDVMNWLDMLMPHELRRVIDALNNSIYAHRQEISVERLTEDEDVAVLSHKELEIILRHAAPAHEYDTSVLSNEQLLRLAIGAQKIIAYTLPDNNSPMMVKRAFANGQIKSLLSGFSSQADVIMAVHHWSCGLTDISLDAVIDNNERPAEVGMYLCQDEHKQVRYGRLFKNSNAGYSFVESYDAGSSTCWFEAGESPLEPEDLPIGLLTNWVFVAPETSPSIVRPVACIQRLSETQRVFLFLRSLSPHVKLEIVAHFNGVMDNRAFTSAEQIGRLTETDWRSVARSIGIDDGSVEYWSDKNAWECFHSAFESLGFNFETREFDPQYEYQANDDPELSDKRNENQ